MINFDYLNKILPQDSKLIDAVIDVFMIEYPGFVEEFKGLVANKQLGQLKKLAHRWQYTAKILGAAELRQNLQKLEQYENLSNMEIDTISIKILGQMAQIFSELTKYESVH